MGKQHVLFLSSLLAAVLVLGGYTAVKAQQKGSSTAAKRWSDAATWPDKKVPGKDAVVTIAKDMNVVLDSSAAVHGLTINGKLSFADNKDLELSTEWIMVHGELEIGTEAKPHTHKATITLTDNFKDEDFGGMGGGDRSDRGDRTCRAPPGARGRYWAVPPCADRPDGATRPVARHPTCARGARPP